jgi:3-oxoacyl-[acyl-carrier-protein] synthase II
MYILQAIASITHQEVFQKEHFWSNLQALEAESSIQHPDYKAFIPANALRRLSPILRMGIACAKSCQENISQPFDSISVGTGLGCLIDTEKFLVTINTTSGDILSPTAFIQSTHNTISGQISLDLKNHAYNMTHTQNTVSFEVALLDGMLCVDEGKQHVLVGAADESVPFLNRLQPDIVPDQYPLTSGATFMVIGNENNSGTIGIAACELSFKQRDLTAWIDTFLANNQLSSADIGLVLHYNELELNDFQNKLSYAPLVGYTMSAPAFAAHLAVDWLNDSANHGAVLLINNMDINKQALTLMQKV